MDQIMMKDDEIEKLKETAQIKKDLVNNKLKGND